MRIIIIGEFSSFAKNLCEGFLSLGHNCFVFSWGDGFKKIQNDERCSYTVKVKSHNSQLCPLNYFYSFLYSLVAYLKLKFFISNFIQKGKADAVLILNDGFVKNKWHFWLPYFTPKMVLKIVKNPSNIYLSACGNDVPYFDYWKEKEWKNKDVVENEFYKYVNSKSICILRNCLTVTKKIIPVMFSYADAWRNSQYTRDCQILDTIPLPISTSKYEVSNTLNKRIVIFHGITRPEFKGSCFIIEAMNKLQKKYPDKVECIIDGKMPLEEYLRLINRTNIIIDQTYSDSVGMNGLYALAMGKVVLSGNEYENQKEYNCFDIPIVNIKPDSNQIYCELEKLILDRDLLMRLSGQSRKYVEKIHDSRIIAKRYLDIFVDSKFE